MIRAFALLLLLAACAPQKSLTPGGEAMSFDSAIVETGGDATARSVAHIVVTGGEHALVVYVQRTDGRLPGISRVQIGDRAVPHRRLWVAEGVEGAMIPHSPDEMASASKTGATVTLCGDLGCYPARIPAGLYQQALLE